MDIFWKILEFIAVSIAIQATIATVLILFGKGKKPAMDDKGLEFRELYLDYSKLPSLKTYKARDDRNLPYRHYPAEAKTCLVLIHGSGWHSQYFLPLAEYISSEGLAQVFTPDLRGHGASPEKRGDIRYINQLEDDLADFLDHVRKDNPEGMVIVGGHSSGGALALRFAGSKYGSRANAYLLLAPFLKYNAPTIRPHSGGWAYAYMGRIAGLSMLNMMGVHWFDFLPVIEFNMPEEARDGSETLSYTHRLNTGYAPRNYKKDLKRTGQPVLVVVGTADDSFIAEQFGPVMSPYANVQTVLLPGVTHMGVVVGQEIQSTVKNWIETLAKKKAGPPDHDESQITP